MNVNFLGLGVVVLGQQMSEFRVKPLQAHLRLRSMGYGMQTPQDLALSIGMLCIVVLGVVVFRQQMSELLVRSLQPHNMLRIAVNGMHMPQLTGLRP